MNNVALETGMFLAAGTPLGVSAGGTGLVVNVSTGTFVVTGGQLLSISIPTNNWLLFVAPTNVWICGATSAFILGKSKLGGADVLG
jgi:hypothetical protein